MLTYSVRPRGGVVHAIELAEALARRGHELTLVGLARPGEGFFRPVGVPAQLIRYEPLDGPFDERIQAMLERYRDGFAELLADAEFDVVHAQDCLSANAALELRDAGLIPHVIRTVHHVDAFTSPSLIACQDRSIVGPDALLCVSEPWVQTLARDFGMHAAVIGNGVDRVRFRPPRDEAERLAARASAGVDGRLVVLTVGGIEPRKGSLTLLEGFARLRALAPERSPLLIVAGGATLFDHRDEVDRFRDRLAQLGIGADVRVLGPVAPAELERLYLAADLFALPSTREGFGLVALEALACELPLVASDLDVFRTFLEHERSALLVGVGDELALGDALARLAHSPAERERLRAGGREVAAAYSWDAVALSQERAYRRLLPSVAAAAEAQPDVADAQAEAANAEAEAA